MNEKYIAESWSKYCDEGTNEFHETVEFMQFQDYQDAAQQIISDTKAACIAEYLNRYEDEDNVVKNRTCKDMLNCEVKEQP